jgi:hypothetical protein
MWRAIWNDLDYPVPTLTAVIVGLAAAAFVCGLLLTLAWWWL